MITNAQHLLMKMGVDPMVVLLGHHSKPHRSYTRSGPGRFHKQGKPKGV